MARREVKMTLEEISEACAQWAGEHHGALHGTRIGVELYPMSRIEIIVVLEDVGPPVEPKDEAGKAPLN